MKELMTKKNRSRRVGSGKNPSKKRSLAKRLSKKKRKSNSRRPSRS
jgi:hypothetical protein